MTPPPAATVPPQSHLGRWHWLGFALVALTTAGIAYLGLRPSPLLREIPWLPGWLSHWADINGVARNTLAFAVFGTLVFTLVGCRWKHLAAVAIFAIGIEVAQLWIPTRIFDPKDIAASLAGIVPAWLLVMLIRRFIGRPHRDLPVRTPPP